MTQTHSPDHRAQIYGAMADRLEQARERDPIQGGDNSNRAAVPMGRGFNLWRRMNAGLELVWIDDIDGHPRAITPKQAEVLSLALEMIDGVGLTMREMALRLHVSPSTVSRALTKFASWGIIGYIVGRGRWAGLVIFRRTANDGKDRFRVAAKARVRAWYVAAQARISRSWINVASRVLDEKGGASARTRDEYFVHVGIGRNIETWTPQDLRDAGII